MFGVCVCMYVCRVCVCAPYGIIGGTGSIEFVVVVVLYFFPAFFGPVPFGVKYIKLGDKTYTHTHTNTGPLAPVMITVQRKCVIYSYCY